MRRVVATAVLILLILPTATAAGNGWKMGDVKGLGKSKDELFPAKKRFLVAWTKLCEKWILRVMERVNSSRMDAGQKEEIKMKLEDALKRIKEMADKINKSQNAYEFRRSVAEIRKEWIEVRKDLELALFQIAIEKVEKIVEKIENLRDRFDTAGMNVSMLDEKIEEIKEKIDTFETLIESEDVAAARGMLHEIKIALLQIFKDLKSTEMGYLHKKLPFMHADVNGTFEFSGNGSVLIRGNFSYTTNAATKTFEKDGVKKVILRGKDITVRAEGDMEVFVHGTGNVTLSGEGSYRVKGELKEINGFAEVMLR